MKTLKAIERMLLDASEKRTWGKIEIDLKDGKPVLVRQTIQSKPEEESPYASDYRK